MFTTISAQLPAAVREHRTLQLIYLSWGNQVFSPEDKTQGKKMVKKIILDTLFKYFSAYTFLLNKMQRENAVLKTKKRVLFRSKLWLV